MGMSYVVISLKVILLLILLVVLLIIVKVFVKKDIKFILYIIFGVVIGCIFIVGIVGLVVCYCSDWCVGVFFFINELMSYEFWWFYGILCVKNYFKVNYYGELVEFDVIVIDFNLFDEF